MQISLLPKVSEYLSLIMTLIFSFGLVFQLPVVTSLMARVGLLTSQGLREKRKWAIVIAFIVAAVLLGSVISSLFAGALADWIGRKYAMVLAGLLFALSIPIIAMSDGYAALLLGRLLQGVSGGLIGVVIPLYLAECAPRSATFPAPPVARNHPRPADGGRGRTAHPVRWLCVRRPW